MEPKFLYWDMVHHEQKLMVMWRVNILHVPGLDCDLFSCTQRKRLFILFRRRKIHLTFLKFTVSDDIPVNGDLRIRLDLLIEEGWKILNTMCEGTPLHDLNLDHFGTRLDMVNKLLRGRVMTRAPQRPQLKNINKCLVKIWRDLYIIIH